MNEPKPDQLAEYAVVLLVEEPLDDDDAARVRALHDGLDDPVVYHLLLPVDDAAERIEASLGSLTGGEMMGGPNLALDPQRLEELHEEVRARSDQDLAASVAALERVGATVAGSRPVTGSPIEELAATIERVGGQEAIVLTRPHVVAEFFHVDWTSQARRKLGVPVLHLLERENFDEQAAGPDGISGA